MLVHEVGAASAASACSTAAAAAVCGCAFGAAGTDSRALGGRAGCAAAPRCGRGAAAEDGGGGGGGGRWQVALIPVLLGARQESEPPGIPGALAAPGPRLLLGLRYPVGLRAPHAAAADGQDAGDKMTMTGQLRSQADCTASAGARSAGVLCASPLPDVESRISMQQQALMYARRWSNSYLDACSLAVLVMHDAPDCGISLPLLTLNPKPYCGSTSLQLYTPEGPSGLFHNSDEGGGRKRPFPHGVPGGGRGREMGRSRRETARARRHLRVGGVALALRRNHRVQLALVFRFDVEGVRLQGEPPADVGTQRDRLLASPTRQPEH